MIYNYTNIQTTMLIECIRMFILRIWDERVKLKYVSEIEKLQKKTFQLRSNEVLSPLST